MCNSLCFEGMGAQPSQQIVPWLCLYAMTETWLVHDSQEQECCGSLIVLHNKGSSINERPQNTENILDCGLKLDKPWQDSAFSSSQL